MTYAAFKGIPYAKPPVNHLRFQPPEETESWEDVLNATTEGSMCIQYNSTSSTVVGSEDCLYLNVFTPHIQFHHQQAKPVMVWIHGGAYRTGNSNASYYGPDFLLEEDVIVVSMNYRLDALGFLSLNHENATGNCGLKDQNLALKWVQKNIANFGGDPKQVTIFGQNAGSVAVDLHILSNMSSGLFKQSIGMSGSTLCLYWGIESASEAEKNAFILGTKLGEVTSNKNELLQVLYKASAHDIVRASNVIPLMPFRPIVEDNSVAKHQEKFLTQCSMIKYTLGNYNKGPHLMGFTAVETSTFGEVTTLLDMVNTALKMVKIGKLDIYLPLLTQIAKLKFSEISNLSETVINQLLKDTSDIFFTAGIDMKQRIMLDHNNYPIYYYRYTFDPQFSAHKTEGVRMKGAGHGDELSYIFYRPHIQLPLEEPTIKITRQRMTRMWTNFAKYSNPTPNSTSDLLGIVWPDSKVWGKHLEISEGLYVKLKRPTDTFFKIYQYAGLGNSHILNYCKTMTRPVSSYVMNSTDRIPDDINEKLIRKLREKVFSFHRRAFIPRLG
ncbi:juvenile hormone esterase-like [Phymastichus coffea]|uniref:juvenile hormone esterase-like n=1 Tax=Phymastichus coffea TaxID=108790 RepID=UPI00273BCDC4|nr:juvenile hormone esterase-like [Phymastichus coffea]XP_058794291.1 juvenile hormone esterase-like [Phymastichus coffea]XP_058794303.1 juvenile hormone esterase-like [Phymastichus coffea]XP_058794313.1 juvenile hormone esterase-like [Phymastichus coffea]